MARKRATAITGRLIVIEGPDGVGKSTICRMMDMRLRARGSATSPLSFPGHETGTLGHLVYRLHHDAATLGVEGVAPLANQAMHVAAHLDAIERVIRPRLLAGHTVILDRFWWSTWVYGLVSGCNKRPLEVLIDAERLAWEGMRPTAAFLLRRPTPVDREGEDMTRWQQLAGEYGRLAAREGEDYPVEVIDNTTSPDACVDAALAFFDGQARPFGQMALVPGSARPGAPAVPPPGTIAGPAIATSHVLPVRPTVAFDTYWRFAAERQAVFFRRLEGFRPPWTDDPILAEYKFTNAYRASDRVSQYLIRHVIYREDLPTAGNEVFFRIMLFKLFNKIETWRALEAAVGPITHESYSFDRYDGVLSGLMAEGRTIYSAAYIMPSGGRTLGYDRKHRNHLTLLDRMMADALPQKISDAPTMQRAFALLRAYPTIGDFLAYQYVTDLNYSDLTNFSEGEFVVPGPGALDGLRKCFSDPGGLNDAEIIRFMADRQEREFERLGLTFRSLWGRALQLIDCQNLFCEVDKYCRVRHPDLIGVSGRLRIKQRFEETPQLPLPWYPPKWRINESIAKVPATTEARGVFAHTISKSSKEGLWS